ncbi:hypothetical protein QUF50_01730 [Thiotrichales bacterium HSG1]|nr:hypothetical protein [Thiotrichales bacterium HSG1]
MYTITLNVNDKSYQNFLNIIKNIDSKDINIISKNHIDDNELDVEIVTQNDKDYKYILAGREEHKKYPENYVDTDSINWD